VSLSRAAPRLRLRLLLEPDPARLVVTPGGRGYQRLDAVSNEQLLGMDVGSEHRQPPLSLDLELFDVERLATISFDVKLFDVKEW
jgi:hypothetical protein